jgi:hypothetical protein
MGDVQDAIKAAVVGTEGVVTGAVAWVDEQRPAAMVIAILDILYCQSLQDRNCYAEDEDNPGSFFWQLSTLYYIRVQVRCEAIYNAPNSDAMVALQKIRAGLLRPHLELDSGAVIQHDNDTYVHHISFPHQGRTINAYAFEVGFRAVVDAPLSPATEEAAPNMQAVIFEETEVDVLEDDPVDFDQTIERPVVI